jgi:hypothetical protein
VIAGGRADGKGFNRLFGGDNDGVVQVVETRLVRPHAFHLVPTIHTLLMNHPETLRIVVRAIENWSIPSTRQEEDYPEEANRA